MFERLGNAEASTEYKFLKKAEDLYLKAEEVAGYKYQGGKLVSVDEVEEIEESPPGSANKAHQDAYFLDPNGLPMISIADLIELVKGDAEKYVPRKMEKAQFSFKEDSDNNKNVTANSENGRDIDGFGNNFENEVLYPRGFSFVVTEVSTDSNGRPYIKVKEIGENVRYQRNSEERSNVLQQMRAESSVHGDLQEVSEQNTLRSGNTENSVQGVRTEKGQIVATSKFSLKENSSDAKNASSYTKAEAVEMVDGIMESLLSFEWGYGELKNRASVINQAHAMLNGAEAGKRINFIC